MQQDIMVSVICLTYNHEKYIRNTLEGFLSQKTNFPFEVIIHDDASTDATAGIIREFETQYPNIIKPIYQTENQYSQKVNIHTAFVIPQIHGRYIALCEGDDYWTDSGKLQRQVDALETHPQCHMCTHRVLEVFEDGIPNGVCFPADPLESGVLPAGKFLEIGKTYSFHTSSYFMRTEQYKKCKLAPPEFVRRCDVGDEGYMLYFASCGDVYYLDQAMSCYRRGVQGSWTSDQRSNMKKTIRHSHRMMEAFALFDQYTNGKFHDSMAQRIARQMAIFAILEKNTHIFLKKENREYFRKLSSNRKVFVLLGVVFPGVMRKVYLNRLQSLSQKRGIV